jgi:hypothetical protein
MSEGGPRLVMIARLTEAVQWDDAVRRHETDPWDHLRRKLDATAEPLREFKREIYDAACARLISDLSKPMLPPGSLETHREAFDALLTISDFADLSFHLDPGADRASRLEGAKSVLEHARLQTLFDIERMAPELRSKAWNKRVEEMSRRLGFDTVQKIVRRTDMRRIDRARVARRVRSRLGEYITVVRGSGPLRDEITPFMLGRIETAIAASLRVLDA